MQVACYNELATTLDTHAAFRQSRKQHHACAGPRCSSVASYEYVCTVVFFLALRSVKLGVSAVIVHAATGRATLLRLQCDLRGQPSVVESSRYTVTERALSSAQGLLLRFCFQPSIFVFEEKGEGCQYTPHNKVFSVNNLVERESFPKYNAPDSCCWHSFR